MSSYILLEELEQAQARFKKFLSRADMVVEISAKCAELAMQYQAMLDALVEIQQYFIDVEPKSPFIQLTGKLPTPEQLREMALRAGLYKKSSMGTEAIVLGNCSVKTVARLFAEFQKLQDSRIAELEAEVARLKTVPMKYRRMEFNAQLQKENEELAAKLKLRDEQEPVATVIDRDNCRVWWSDKFTHISQAPANNTKLYAAPVAAPAIPEGYAKDAERYRWLRDDNAYFPEENLIMGGEELDIAIDREIAAAQTTGDKQNES